jgi:Chaperone of endosialidase
VSAGNLTNATAIGAGATVNASNKVRLGNTAVTVIEGQVAFTASSDKTKKENFEPVDGEEVLGKIRGFELSSWNFIGHDPKEFRHYGPMAQDFFTAFGHDGVGQIGSETTINSGDLAGILMIAIQALEKRTAELRQKEAQIVELKAKQAYFETVVARVEALELRQNPSIQITAEKRVGNQ